MKRPFIATVALLGAAIASAPAGAVPIVDQAFDPTLAGQASNLGGSPSEQIADEFFSSTMRTLGTLTWYGRYEGPIGAVNPTTFTIRIFSDSGGAPPTTPAFETTVMVAPVSTGLDFGGSPWFSYSANIFPALAPVGTFWVSILESDASTALSGDSVWLWAESGSTGALSGRSSEGGFWERDDSTNNMAFTLHSNVPEPSTWLLLGSGLVLAMFRGRRRGESLLR